MICGQLQCELLEAEDWCCSHGFPSDNSLIFIRATFWEKHVSHQRAKNEATSYLHIWCFNALVAVQIGRYKTFTDRHFIGCCKQQKCCLVPSLIIFIKILQCLLWINFLNQRLLAVSGLIRILQCLLLINFLNQRLLAVSGLIQILTRLIQILTRMWAQSLAESYQKLWKWYSMLPCLALSTTKGKIEGKWQKPGKGVERPPLSSG